MNIIDFSNAPEASFVFYGGDAGAKEALLYDNATWMIKYPKTTRDLVNPQISYTTSPLSEYLGTKIYQLLGHPTHDVLLGVRKNKLVVACKDFTWESTGTAGQHKPYELIHFHYLKNRFMSSDLESYSGTGSETLLDEVLATIEGEKTLTALGGVSKRFWDMFVIDAFIGNNDRNNGNWGVLLDQRSGTIALAPVYDNGNAFFNKRSTAQMHKRLGDDNLMADDAYRNPTCVYKYKDFDSESHKINPFQFLEKTQIAECRQALERFLVAVNLEQIDELIDSIPEHHEAWRIMPSQQKVFYKKLLELRLDKLQAIAAGYKGP